METRVLAYTDGGARGNPGPAAIGILIYSATGTLLEDYKEYIGESTNNRAEYAAISKALQLASKHTRSEVFCHSDSKLVISQLSGIYRIKEPGLRKAFDAVKEAEKRFSYVKYIHLPRTDPRIRLADNLVNRVLDAMA